MQDTPEPVWAFHPEPLPPDPALAMDEEIEGLLDRANQALGRLDGITLLLPNPDQFIYSYVRKEAVLSSQIEGAQSSLSDLLLFEQEAAPTVSPEDVRETSNYIAAMDLGLRLLKEGLPVSLRLIRAIHGSLLQSGRGSERDPGEFRSSQNWVGGSRPGNARFVPPPPHLVTQAMGDLEKFLHDDPVASRTLVKAALAHAQFQTVHPFLDGNGRVGRLLITLLLCDEKILSRPLLYLSLFLKRNRDAYYEALQRIRTHGDWEHWLRFFLEGVVEVAEGATDTTMRLVRLIDEDRKKVHGLGRAAGTAISLYEHALSSILVTAPRTARRLGVSEPTTYKAIRHLEGLGIQGDDRTRRRPHMGLRQLPRDHERGFLAGRQARRDDLPAGPAIAPECLPAREQWPEGRCGRLAGTSTMPAAGFEPATPGLGNLCSIP